MPDATTATVKIYRTKDYKRFVLHAQNRPIKNSTLRGRRADMEAFGGWDPCRPMEVCRKGNKLDIRDGQHRLMIAEEHGWWVYYAISSKDVTPEQINAHQSGWTLSDYVHSFVQINRQDYRVLRDFVAHYKLPTSIAATLLAGAYTRSGQGASRDVKEGTFKVIDKPFADSVAGLVWNIRPIFKAIGTERAISALAQCVAVKGFDLDGFYHQCKKHPGMLRPCGTIEQYLEMFEQVYNWRNKTGALPLRFHAIQAAKWRKTARSR